MNQIKSHYGFRKDAEFASFLGITPQSLSNWKSRDTFDPVLVYTKCEDLNPHWLLRGEGEMLKSDNKRDYTPFGKKDDSMEMREENAYTPYPSNENVSPKKAYPVSPAVSPTHENCRICEEKERIIANQQLAIDTMRELVDQLRIRVEELGGVRKKQNG